MIQILIVLLCVSIARAAFPGESDLVTALPGVTFALNYKHYSGYLESTNGTQLHYWFFESQTGHSEKDPVVLWLNGGPGCSSIWGALTELGPLRVNGNGSVSSNPYGWNQHANILFLESPGGVGFSFKPDHIYHSNDHSTAQLNFEALQSFYRKFPHLTENPFYITGESYAGIYIPTLAVISLKEKFPKNFKGVAIGNGLLHFLYNYNSVLHFYFYHGLVGATEYSDLIAKCCSHTTELRNCDIIFSQNSACNAAQANFITKAHRPLQDGIDPYNIYDVCAKIHRNYSAISREVVDWDRLYEWVNMGDYYDAQNAPVCAKGNYLEKYLNQPEVREALHIDPKAWEWESCRGRYKINYPPLTPDKNVTQEVRQMVNSGLKVLIFNGDVDTVCNFVGAEWFVDSLGYRIRAGSRPWKTPTGQVGGYVKFYENHLIFATVMGAGHMSPKDKPEATLTLLHNLLSPFTEFE